MVMERGRASTRTRGGGVETQQGLRKSANGKELMHFHYGLFMLISYFSVGVCINCLECYIFVSVCVYVCVCIFLVL